MNGISSVLCKSEEVCRCFASFSSEQEHFTHAMYMTALIHPSDVKNRNDHVPDGKGDTAPENFGIYPFIEHDRFNFFTSEGRIRAVMYMACVKCTCSELKLAKHLHIFFVLT